MRYFLNSLLAISTVISFEVSAGNLTLPDGRALQNAYVILKRPDGLEIGHTNGVMFVNFTELPESIRKKYNYSPKEAEKYISSIAAAKERRAQELARLKAEQAKAFEEEQQKAAEMQFEQLGIEIQQYQNRIANLKAEIPRLEQSYSYLLSKSSQMIMDNPVMDQTSFGSDYFWNGGFITTGGGQGARKKEAIKQITDEAAETKDMLDSDRKELQQKGDRLVIMRSTYEKAKVRKAMEDK